MMIARIEPPLTAQERRHICHLAAVDDRTVKKWARGGPVRSTCAERIEAAVATVRASGKRAA